MTTMSIPRLTARRPIAARFPRLERFICQIHMPSPLIGSGPGASAGAGPAWTASMSAARASASASVGRRTMPWPAPAREAAGPSPDAEDEGACKLQASARRRREPVHPGRAAVPDTVASVGVSERVIPHNLADLVGGTPLVRLSRLAPDCEAELVGKLEAYNPAGSVKDRIGVAMIDAAEAEGRIEPGKTTIVEPTSGNTGIALAFVCAAKGYELVLTLPQGMSRERENLLRLYGARVEITESLGGMNEAVDAACQMASQNPDCWRPDQFSNPANPEIHRRTTAEEIWSALDGDVDALVSGV